MIKVSVMYPNTPGARFDHAYYRDKHSFQPGFGTHAREILADTPNDTDLSPVLQISEVVVGQP